MAHQSMRVNLASVVFPFSMDLWGRSIIAPQFDENYERQLVSSADIGKDKGVPMACYLHNCMPTTEGYQAVGFKEQALGVAGETAFDKVFPLTYTVNNDARFLFSPAGGENYIFDATLGGWAKISSFPNGVIGNKTIITTAYVQGNTYIFFQKIGCFIYDQVNKVLTPVTLLGLDPTTITGITASFGYLLCYNATNVVWSNATNPLDFVPSLITGAGGGGINDIKGNIVLLLSTPDGLIAFCEKNIVGGRFTGNVRFPFVFKEIPGSGGIASPDQVSIGNNSSSIYVYSSSGIQQVTLSTCENVFPDCTDYLAKNMYEDFDDVNLVWTETFLATPMSVKISIVSDRFVVFSYGITLGAYTYAVIYDNALKRWGKVKVNHVAAFEWNSPNLFGAITYAQLGVLGLTYGDLANITYGDLATSVNTQEAVLDSLAFLQADGTVLTVNFDLAEVNVLGTLLLGKYQFQRNKFITHQFTDIENIRSTAPLAVYIIPTLDGKTFESPVPAVQTRVQPNAQRWAKRVTGQNYSMLFQGAFNLVSIVTDFTLNGDR